MLYMTLTFTSTYYDVNSKSLNKSFNNNNIHGNYNVRNQLINLQLSNAHYI